MPEYPFKIIEFYEDWEGGPGDWVYVIPTELYYDEMTQDEAKRLTVAEPSYFARN